ncbi:MAG: ribokinase [Pseudorhodobacter sp.]
MAVYTLGSINIDHIYHVPHIPRPGETLTATALTQGLGGKGANQSVAAARAGAKVRHIGAVGPGADPTLAELAAEGIDISRIARLGIPTGHAIISLDPQAENAITVFPGANRALTATMAEAALAGAQSGDILLMQNETSAQVETARLADRLGLRLFYSPAPFDLAALRAVLPFADLLLMNDGEAGDLRRDNGALPDIAMIVTRGVEGATWLTPGCDPLSLPAFPVEALDTTGAGDCFAGNIAAALDAGLPQDQAMRRALAAAALQVTRPGAAPAMPRLAETLALLSR